MEGDRTPCEKPLRLTETKRVKRRTAVRIAMASKERRSLKIAILVSLGILVMEVLGGLLSGSLALLSDAGHIFLDLVALSIALIATDISQRPSSQVATFGYFRAKVLAGLVNAMLLILLTFAILYEAYCRLLSPQSVKATEMLIVATIGLFANLFVIWELRPHRSLSVKGAYLHVLGDTATSFAVIFAGVLISITGQYVIDPLISVLIALIIIIGSSKLLGEALNILMEKTPKHIKIQDVVSAILGIEGVRDVHDIHIWSISSDIHAMSAHILVDPMEVERTQQFVHRINEALAERFGICHTTFQFESKKCDVPQICEVTQKVSDGEDGE